MCAAKSVLKYDVDLFFDVMSPYSWVQFEALTRYAKLWPINLHLKPFVLRDVMKATGNKPPLTVPAKGMYMLKDLERNNAFWGMEMKPPAKFAKWVRNPETNTVNAQKILIAVQMERPELLEAVARSFWKRIWSDGEPIFSNDDIVEVLKAAGVAIPINFLEKLSCPKVEAALKKNTDEAIEQGCFGAPWTVVHRNNEAEGFFGSDRMHFIAQMMGQRFTDGQTHLSKL